MFQKIRTFFMPRLACSNDANRSLWNNDTVGHNKYPDRHAITSSVASLLRTHQEYQTNQYWPFAVFVGVYLESSPFACPQGRRWTKTKSGAAHTALQSVSLFRGIVECLSLCEPHIETFPPLRGIKKNDFSSFEAVVAWLQRLMVLITTVCLATRISPKN